MTKTLSLRLTGMSLRMAAREETVSGAFEHTPFQQTALSQPDDGTGRGRSLAGLRLLILEDDYLIGRDLAHGPRLDGMEILGPYFSVAQAQAVLDETGGIDAAILDLNMHGQITFDVADKLIDRRIPFVFYTGYDSVIVPAKFRAIKRLQKPADWPEIRRVLFGGDDPALARQRLVKRPSSDAPDLTSLLPVLRRRARQITSGAEPAERLVERTLERAIKEIENCPAGMPMEHWLIELLESTGIGDARHLN